MDREYKKKFDQAMKLVRDACVKFDDEHHPQFLNYELIEQYLAATAHIDIEESTRLISFSGHFSKLGWDETSNVHRYVIDVLGRKFEYTIWILEGLTIMADQNEILDYRKHIAEDVEKLLKEETTGDEQWAAWSWGQFYVKHPLRDDRDPKWLREAEKWFEISNSLLSANCEIGTHELCALADVYRQRGKLTDAASLYREALSRGLKGCCEDTYRDKIEARLAMCDSDHIPSKNNGSDHHEG